MQTPTPSMTVDPETVTPGFIGFAFMALVVLAVVLLLIDMLRRVRRTRYRAEVNAELDAEQATAAEAADGDVDEGTDPPSAERRDLDPPPQS